ncbi:hypothetical protein M0R45_025286 [Rubus argutus]|uniref:Uncharacterized protein n=1 Tax=Rubus argutus TaxID=59490 RepID=A0AAW1WWN7_RUBAR
MAESAVKEEIVYLRGELERMTAFLRIADASEESDEELKHMIMGRDYMVQFIGLSCCIKNTKARYRIASELQGINLRIRKISEVHKRLRHKFNTAEQGSGSTSAGNAWEDHRGDALLLEKTDIVGIDKPIKQLRWMAGEGWFWT